MDEERRSTLRHDALANAVGSFVGGLALAFYIGVVVLLAQWLSRYKSPARIVFVLIALVIAVSGLELLAVATYAKMARRRGLTPLDLDRLRALRVRNERINTVVTAILVLTILLLGLSIAVLPLST